MVQAAKSSQDDDWCFRSESSVLLALSIAQIHTSLTEGDNSVNTLSESFQQLAQICLKVERLAKSEESELEPSTCEQISVVAEDMSGQINKAIMAFQFYDRLCQRLEHVAGSLENLSELLKDEDKLHESSGWRVLRDSIKAQYTMKEEHLMYDAIMQGANVNDALKIYKDGLALQQAVNEDDIELF